MQLVKSLSDEHNIRSTDCNYSNSVLVVKYRDKGNVKCQWKEKKVCAFIKYIPVTSQQNIPKHFSLLNKKPIIPCSLVMHLMKSICEKIELVLT